jgi:hypothetical protein
MEKIGGYIMLLAPVVIIAFVGGWFLKKRYFFTGISLFLIVVSSLFFIGNALNTGGLGGVAAAFWYFASIIPRTVTCIVIGGLLDLTYKRLIKALPAHIHAVRIVYVLLYPTLLFVLSIYYPLLFPLPVIK